MYNISTILQSITLKSSEREIEQKIVIPLLELLDYHTSDWQDQVKIGRLKPDFIVHPENAPILHPSFLIIEVKAANKKLSNRTWQIIRYMRKTGAIFGLLTNGYDFHILYNDHNNIISIAQYSQTQLIQQYVDFYKLLCKDTCLNFLSVLYSEQEQTKLKFLQPITPKLNNLQSPNHIEKTEILTANTMIEPTKQARIITVFNNKGGVGKTTTTINLAAALNQLGKKVLLVDIDAQANLTTGLGIDPLQDVEHQGKKDISHLLTEPRLTLEEVMFKKRWNDIQLDIIPSHIRLSDMENTLNQTPDIDRILSKKLKKYRSEYDYILIDPPPSFGKVNTIALMASSSVLIPVQFSPYPIRALEYVINRAIAVSDFKDEKLPILGVAISMYQRRSSKVTLNMTQEIFEILDKNISYQEIELFPEDTWIPQLQIVSISAGKGYPLCYAEHDDKLTNFEKQSAQDAWNCYTNLAEHIMTIKEVH